MLPLIVRLVFIGRRRLPLRNPSGPPIEPHTILVVVVKRWDVRGIRPVKKFESLWYRPLREASIPK
jgi:hypothetical protein